MKDLRKIYISLIDEHWHLKYDCFKKVSLFKQVQQHNNLFLIQYKIAPQQSAVEIKH